MQASRRNALCRHHAGMLYAGITPECFTPALRRLYAGMLHAGFTPECFMPALALLDTIEISGAKFFKKSECLCGLEGDYTWKRILYFLNILRIFSEKKIEKTALLWYDLFVQDKPKLIKERCFSMFTRNIITEENENGNIEIEIIKDTGEILIDFSATGRERPWNEKKAENEKLTELLRIVKCQDENEISDNQLYNIENCGTFLKFGITANHERKLAGANFCKFRLCPMCAWRRSLKMFGQVSAITDKILSEKKVRFLFLTLTVKNCKGENLRDTIKSMNEGFRRIVKNSGHYKASKKLRENLCGYLKAIEVTYSEKRDDFHPHIHCILEVKPDYFYNGYMKQKDFQTMWRELMNLDYDPQVDIRTIKNSTAKAVAEVAKYPVKLKSLLLVKNKFKAVKAVKELKDGIANLRFVEFGGDFKTYKRLLELDDVEDGNLVHTETDKQKINYIAYQIFRYDFKSGFYVC